MVSSIGQIYDVVIVGAGISGLVAANELKKRSSSIGKPLSILVLEAKDRVGGRTETVTMRTATATDQFDLGGQWVGLTQRHILDLLKELRLDIYPQFVDGMKVTNVGSTRNITNNDSVLNTLKSLTQFSPFGVLSAVVFLREVESMAAKLDPLAPFNTPEAADWDTLTVYQFAVHRSYCGAGKSRIVLDALDVICRTVYGVPADRLSFLYFLVFIKECGSLVDLCEATGNGAQAFRIVGGAQQISRLLAENLGWDRVRLRQPVWKVRHGSDGVDVWVVGESEVNLVTAKQLILAIPPQQIGRILFEPPLPEDQIQLFASFPAGNLFKFNVTYEVPFWRQKGYSAEIVATGVTEDPNVVRPVGVTYDATTSHGSPAIVGFMNTEWSGTNPEVRKSAVLADLARYLGQEAFDCIDYVDKSWSEEPYTGGCPVGSVAPGAGSFYATGVRRITGPIHFAGTETARQWMGYMSGAVEAGLRASHEALSFLTPTALSEVELDAVASSMALSAKKLGKTRFYKKSNWLTWKTAAVAFAVGAVAGVIAAKRMGFESPVKIRLIYSL